MLPTAYACVILWYSTIETMIGKQKSAIVLRKNTLY